ncbi:MAG TPA: hypothetical protein PKU97_12695 [Kofleriaceae bacterium]|nr:hypothetical protein [Kofleriaceae bacterium]
MTSEEILSEYEEGIYSRGDTLSRLTDVAAADGIERTIRALPDSWQAALEQWIFDTYDNDVESDQFLFFGDPSPDRDQHRRNTAILREWIREKKNLRCQES